MGQINKTVVDGEVWYRFMVSVLKGRGGKKGGVYSTVERECDKRNDTPDSYGTHTNDLHYYDTIHTTDLFTLRGFKEI